MRPIELKVEGLTSFRARQEVRFDNMEDLFAIVGPTGSGKSTLLDALALALYGEIPRSKEIKEFISLGMDLMRLSLRFRVGEKEYLVARTFHRKKNQEASLEEILSASTGSDGEEERTSLVPDGKIKEINKAIEDLLGMDYQIFSRVILLPQGDFAEFLRGDAKERRRSIIKLLDYEKFDKVGALARKHASDLNTRIEMHLQSINRDYSADTPENLHLLEISHKEVEGKIALYENLSRELFENLKQSQQLEQRVKALSALEKAVQSLSSQVVSLHREWEGLQPQEEKIEEERQKAQKHKGECVLQVEEAQRALEEVLQRSGDENHLSAMKQAAVSQEEVLERLRLLMEEKERLSAALASSEEDMKLKETGLKQAEEAEVAARATLAATELKSRESKASLTLCHQQGKLRQEIQRTQSLELKATDRLREFEALVQEAETSLEMARTHQGNLLREHHVAALAQNLNPGDPCPVCIRPLESKPSTHSSGHEALLQAEEDVKEAEKNLQQTSRQRDEARLSHARLQGDVSRLTSQLAEMGSALDEGEVTARLSEAAAECERAETELAHASLARKRQGEEKTESRALHERTLSRLSSQQEQEELARSRIDLNKKIIREGFPAGVPEDLLEHIDARQSALAAARKHHATTGIELRQALERLHSAEEARSRHQSERSHLETQAEVQRERTVTGAEHLRAHLLPLTGSPEANEVLEESVQGVPPFPSSLPLSEKLLLLREAANRFEALIVEHLPRSEESLEELRINSLSRLRSSDEDLDSLTDLTTASSVLDRHLRLLSGREAKLFEQKANMAKRIELRREREEEIARDRLLAERYKKLGSDMRSDKFVTYALEESFQEMAARASVDLKLVSAGRYSLAATKDQFFVIDHWNADDERSVATLSGGESFLASLSLAMALSQGLRDLAGDAVGARLESVFIDEGFGTLDPEALEMVGDALERLQETGRSVGIITHVPSLAERIPSGLEVVPGPSGSTVRSRGV